MNKSNKSKTVALLLCIFLGYLGVHRFYVGKTKTGILYLFTVGLCGIGWIVDIILIATDKFIFPVSGIKVYTTSDSNKYHFDPHCYGMLSTISMDIDKARRKGLKPCSRCCHR